MMDLFILTTLLSLIITRLFSHLLHDEKNFGSIKEKSKTITFLFRRITGRDFHHIHLGFTILLLAIILRIIFDRLELLLIPLAISLSLISDQIVPYLSDKKGYFTIQRVIESLIIHLVIIVEYQLLRIF